MNKVNTGETVRVVYFNTPSTGDKYEKTLNVSDDLEVKKAGKISFTVKTSMGGRNFKQEDIGKPVPGLFRNSWVIVITRDMDADLAISDANKVIKESLESKVSLYKRLIQNHSIKLTEQP